MKGELMPRKTKLPPVHPGEILREEFLVPLALSINGLARALRVPPSHVSGIVNEKRGISAGWRLLEAKRSRFGAVRTLPFGRNCFLRGCFVGN